MLTHRWKVEKAQSDRWDPDNQAARGTHSLGLRLDRNAGNQVNEPHMCTWEALKWQGHGTQQ